MQIHGDTSKHIENRQSTTISIVLKKASISIVYTGLSTEFASNLSTMAYYTLWPGHRVTGGRNWGPIIHFVVKSNGKLVFLILKSKISQILLAFY